MFRMAECDGFVFCGNLCSVIQRTVYAAWPCGVLRRADCSLSTMFGKIAATHALATLQARAFSSERRGERCFIAEPRRIGVSRDRFDVESHTQARPTSGSGLTVELYGELATMCLGGVPAATQFLG